MDNKQPQGQCSACGDAIYEAAHLDCIARLEQERDELKAHCEAMRELVEHLANIGNDFGFGPYQPGLQEIEAAQVSLCKTPAQSLAEIRAQAVEEFSDMLSSDFAELAYEYADQLRKEAE